MKTDREIIEMLMAKLEGVGVGCLTMVASLSEPWKTSMQNNYDSSKEAIAAAQDHLDKYYPEDEAIE